MPPVATVRACVCVNMPEALATHCYCLNTCQATVCLPKTSSAQITCTLSWEGRCKILKPIPCNSWLCPSLLSLARGIRKFVQPLGFCVLWIASAKAGRTQSWQETTVSECVCVLCLSVCLPPHSFILSVLFVHLDVLIFKRKDLCWYL